MGDCTDNIVLEAFTNGLKDKDLIRSLYTHPSEDFDDIMSQTKTYMIANEVLHSSNDETSDLMNQSNKRRKHNE